MAQSRPNQSASIFNSTTNFLASLFPINQILKFFQMKPIKHDPKMLLNNTYRNNKLSMTTTTQSGITTSSSNNNLITTLAKRRLDNAATRNANRRTKTTKLPRVTPLDLFNINQIHAASLNGLAGQFNSIQDRPQDLPPTDRKASSINQFVQVAPPPQPAQVPPMMQIPVSPGVQQPPSELAVAPNPPRLFRPQTGQQPPMQTTTAQSVMPQFSLGSVPVQTNSQQPTPVGRQTPSSVQSSSPPTAATTTSNKFSSMSQLPTTATSPSSSSSVAYDSSPLATTNSISVHQQQQQLPTTTSHSVLTNGHHNHFGNQNPNVLSSTFASSASNAAIGSSIRHHAAHNNLANSAKYSLDGIIAVAIFGGFIFLGAIITIIVIIIRRLVLVHFRSQPNTITLHQFE